MSNADFMARAVTPMVEIIRNIKPEHLAARTPCAEYHVRKVVNHLLFWGPSLEGAGRKEAVAPPAEAEADVDLTSGDWAAALEAQLGRTVAAWREPAAWEGTTQMAGPMDMPAAPIGGMIVGELVVHGWDLARATGQHPAWDDDLLEYLREEVTKGAQQGRDLGAYGPEVAVPASASTLDHVLGLTGRDPAWTP